MTTTPVAGGRHRRTVRRWLLGGLVGASRNLTASPRATNERHLIWRQPRAHLTQRSKRVDGVRWHRHDPKCWCQRQTPEPMPGAGLHEGTLQGLDVRMHGPGRRR